MVQPMQGLLILRGEATGIGIDPNPQPLEIGKGRVLREGSSVAIFSYGTRLGEALIAAEQLETRRIWGLLPPCAGGCRASG